MSDFDLSGRVAVVTGAGRGIGEGIARAFAHAGACVVLAARTQREIECVASTIRECGGHAIAVRADVTDTFALGSLATTAVEEYGHLDIWVNNAGGAEVGKPLAELKRSEWDEVVDLNFTAVWNGAMAAVEQMHWGIDHQRVVDGGLRSDAGQGSLRGVQGGGHLADSDHGRRARTRTSG